MSIFSRSRSRTHSGLPLVFSSSSPHVESKSSHAMDKSTDKSSVHDQVKKQVCTDPQTSIHSIPLHEHKGQQNVTKDKNNKQKEKKMDKCAGLRCLRICVAVVTLLFLAASVVGCFFLIECIQRIDDQQATISTLKKSQAKVGEVIKSLQTSLHSQQKRISTLQKQLSDQRQIKKDQQKNISFLQSVVTNQFNKTISDLKKSIAAKEEEEAISEPGTDVFFTARTASNNIMVPASETVVYDFEMLSKGGGYSANSGVFTAPRNGNYKAEVYAVAQKNKLMYVGLMHNGLEIADIHADGTVDGGHKSGSNSVTVHLDKGDTLYVMAHKPSYLYSKYMNTFSVYLI